MKTEASAPSITANDRLRLALESGSCIETIRRFLAGKRVRSTTHDRIEAAALRLNLPVSH